MCGIVCAFKLKEPAESLRLQILSMAKCIRHRGPDWSGVFSNEKAIMAHERLAICRILLRGSNLFSVVTGIWFLPPMVKSTTIWSFGNNSKITSFKLKVIAR